MLRSIREAANLISATNRLHHMVYIYRGTREWTCQAGRCRRLASIAVSSDRTELTFGGEDAAKKRLLPIQEALLRRAGRLDLGKKPQRRRRWSDLCQLAAGDPHRWTCAARDGVGRKRVMPLLYQVHRCAPNRLYGFISKRHGRSLCVNWKTNRVLIWAVPNFSQRRIRGMKLKVGDGVYAVWSRVSSFSWHYAPIGTDPVFPMSIPQLLTENFLCQMTISAFLYSVAGMMLLYA